MLYAHDIIPIASRHSPNKYVSIGYILIGSLVAHRYRHYSFLEDTTHTVPVGYESPPMTDPNDHSIYRPNLHLCSDTNSISTAG